MVSCKEWVRLCVCDVAEMYSIFGDPLCLLPLNALPTHCNVLDVVADCTI